MSIRFSSFKHLKSIPFLFQSRVTVTIKIKPDSQTNFKDRSYESSTMLNVANPAGMYCLGLLSIANKVYLRCFSRDLKTQKHSQSFYVPKLISCCSHLAST